MPYKMNRRAYVETYGPTVGDRIRLADTELFIEVEQDYTSYGDEVKFGGGKVIRDGMGQSPISNADGAVDLVITNPKIKSRINSYPEIINYFSLLSVKSSLFSGDV